MTASVSLVNSHLPSIRQLQCFLAVAQELNFRKAADRLNMTQPPLTRQIKGLEDILGKRLFTRNTHEVHLTDTGRLLVAKVESVLGHLNELMESGYHDQTPLRIGSTRALNFGNIPSIHRKLKKLGAGEDIDAHNLSSGQLLQCLVSNDMDMVLIGEQRSGLENEVQFHWLHQEPLLMALPVVHRASQQEKVSLHDVAELPLFWFARNANPALYDKCENYFNQLNLTLKRIKEPDDSLITLARIARGKGIALMPQSMCTFNQAGLCYRQLSDDAADYLNVDIYAAIRKDEHRKAVLDALVILLSDSAARNIVIHRQYDV